MKQFSILPVRRFLAPFVVAFAVSSAVQTNAQPFIVSTVPATGDTGVSPSAAVVFTFSEQMDTALTTADFIDPLTFASLPTTSVWSANDTVLTCTPSPPFPANKLIGWFVDGESLIGDPIEGETTGYFTTGTGGGGGTGTGTNRLTDFAIGKTHFYNQTSAAAPSLDADVPYLFSASTILSSNRTATGISVMLPTGAVSNLTQNFVRPEEFFLFSVDTNLALFDSAFPSGNYAFNVMAATSNQQVTVNLPGALTQPNAPHIANFTAAQSVNATQPFQLSWDAFAGGTAVDYISVSIGNAFKTPDPFVAGALNGTATSVTVPGGTLQSGSNYNVIVSFYRFSFSSNASYTTSASLSTSTEFNLTTSSGGVGGTLPLIFTNAVWSGSALTFDVVSSPGQIFTVEYSSTLRSNQWQSLLTTTSATGVASFVIPGTNQHLFFRAWKAP